MYLILEPQLINQLYLCKLMVCVTLGSLLRYFFLRRIFMEWLADSRDINPIENVWELLNERAKEKNLRNVYELLTNGRKYPLKMQVINSFM